MPFIFIVPVWLLIVLAALPLLFVRKLRFLAVHMVMASTMAILISFSLAISVLVAGGRLPVSRLNGLLIFCIFALSLVGGGVLGLVLGIFLAAVFTAALSDEGIVFALPVVQIILGLIVALIAGVLAAILPARRASRLNVLEAISVCCASPGPFTSWCGLTTGENDAWRNALTRLATTRHSARIAGAI